MAVHDRFLQSARRHSDRLAVVAGERRWTYAELRHQAFAVAGALRDRGLQPADRVAVDLGNHAAAVPVLWGTLLAGGAFVFLDPTAPPERFVQLLRDFRPRALFSRDERLRDLSGSDLPPAVWSDDRGPSSLAALLAEDPPDLAPAAVDDASLASLVYTSGSTGSPKGVMMTHGSIGAAMDGITTYLGSSARDVVLNLLPLSFDYGHYQVLMTGATGGCLVLEPGFGYPGTLLGILREQRVTTLPCVPTLLALLLSLDTFTDDHLPDLRTFTNTGAGVPVPHVREVRRRFAAARLYLMYGLTECKRVSYLPPDEVDARPESVGIPMPGCEVAVVDAAGQSLPANVVGELVVRGPHLMTGYWERPDATRRVLRPGPWPGKLCLYTGDRFHRDEDGYLFFHGREDDVFKCRGEKVAPAEVEAVLHELEGVEEAAVLGVDHPLLGHAVVAVVVTRPGWPLDAATVRRHCARHLESVKVPHEVRFLDELPHNARGKVDRSALHRALTPERQT